MQRAIIGDITEMGITPAGLSPCETCLNQGRYCTVFMQARQSNRWQNFILA